MNDHHDPDDIPEVLPAEPRRGKRPRYPEEEDQLEGYWKAIIWGSVLVPCVGGWIIVVLSSVMYYVWLKQYPHKAKSINRHGWMAWLLGQVLGVLLYVFLSQFQLGR